MAEKPIRIQLSRKGGFNLQKHSKSVNGLGAVNVARPSKWGNPFIVHGSDTAEIVVRLYAEKIAPSLPLIELKGKNLACWCEVGQCCHADILLEMANEVSNEQSS